MGNTVARRSARRPWRRNHHSSFTAPRFPCSKNRVMKIFKRTISIGNCTARLDTLIVKPL